MEKPTTGLRVLPSPEDIRQLLRARIVETVQLLLEEELTAILGSQPYERTEARIGYRNGSERRRVTTENGPMDLQIPRARIEQPDGSSSEFRSAVLLRIPAQADR